MRKLAEVLVYRGGPRDGEEMHVYQVGPEEAIDVDLISLANPEKINGVRLYKENFEAQDGLYSFFDYIGE